MPTSHTLEQRPSRSAASIAGFRLRSRDAAKSAGWRCMVTYIAESVVGGCSLMGLSKSRDLGRTEHARPWLGELGHDRGDVTLQARCDLLRALHVPGTPLVLPNAWDVPSARVVVAAGFPVVATTSAGVAAVLGYEDGERAPASEMFFAAGLIARSVDVPVTADTEAGYGLSPD